MTGIQVEIMKRYFKCVCTMAVIVLSANVVAEEGPHDSKIRALLASEAGQWVNDPKLIEAIKRQNSEHASLGQRDIDDMDKQWRKEAKSDSRPMIDEVLNTDLSKFLKKIAEESNGLYSEIFVMDNKGLNVAQSDVTSDYWQGDEDKWQKTYLVGPDALHIANIEYDNSSRSFQIQASVPVVDPTTKTNIGAITLGLSMRQLALRTVK